MEKFSLEYPFILALIFVFILCHKLCPAKTKFIYFPHIKTLLASQSKQISLLPFLKWTAIVSVIVALSSPVLTKSYTNSKKEGRDIVLILDSSNSMKQIFDTSYRSRWQVAKDVVAKFIESRKSDRIGMITFADIAFISSPLTFEKEFLQKITKMQQLGVAGTKTAINDAIVQSYNLLSKSKAKTKIAILLTDGVDNMSKVGFNELLSLVKNEDIKLYTIGIGTQRNYNGVYLKALAKAGKAEAYGATNSNELQKIYKEIDKLEATKIDNKKVIQYTYLYLYPLLLAILSLLLFLFLKNKKEA